MAKAKRSDPTGAARAKRYRANKRLLASGPVTDHPAPVTLPPPALPEPAPAPSSPLHGTKPVAVSSADGFAVVPVFDAGDGQEGEPFAPPPPEPPKEEKPPLTDDEVAGVALGILGYWKWGVAALVQKNPDLLGLLQQLPPEMQAAMPKVDAFVYSSAVRVCQKYRLRVPYQDELVVAAAIGLASFGLFGPPLAKPGGEAAPAEEPSAPIATPATVTPIRPTTEAP